MNETELWLEIKKVLSSNPNVDQEVYNDYISNAKLIKNDKDEYSLIVKSKFAASVITPNQDIIINELKNHLGKSVLFEIITNDIYKKTQKVIKNAEVNKTSAYKFSFETFIHGESNNQAFLASKTVSNNPGQQFNPLFIYGDSGLGKTHLLHAINHEISTNKPELKVLYLSSEVFIKGLVDIIYQGHDAIEKYKDEITQNDVLIVDDIQFLAKKEKTNEVFFTIFNHFIENGKQLVFSSDKSPDHLNGFDNRMITRFNLGLTTSIKTLDFETAHSIVESEIKSQGIIQKVEEEAIKYLASYYADDVRKIKGSVSKISFWSIQNTVDTPVDMEVISELFKDVPTSNLGVLNVKKIKEVVGESYGVTIKSIDGKARTANIANARHLSMYLAKEILNHSLSQIGTEFGGKDHTTVISAMKKMTKLIASDKEFNNVVETLKNKILTK
ncbi:chromosomal replication initiator protein DnaA [[Acholeplasma] multilocale]|uniref:chromosomal replication initiator protein DnaA n=1 Tax=[Acholeplasma] multilocale TaxID=264638 RepID=UPI00047B9941|nr:chromosomal replication initiator protein DnaA [[Acholeplasma] multilocale]